MLGLGRPGLGVSWRLRVGESPLRACSNHPWALPDGHHTALEHCPPPFTKGLRVCCKETLNSVTRKVLRVFVGTFLLRSASCGASAGPFDGHRRAPKECLSVSGRGAVPRRSLPYNRSPRASGHPGPGEMLRTSEDF